MKRILQERKIIEILKEYNSKFSLLNEAKSKIDVLINKLGASEENAKILDNMFGGLSVWMANKIGEYFFKLYPDDYGTTKEVLKRLYLKASSYQQQFTSIKDYIVVGLNGNKSSLDNLDYKQIYDKSKEWHDSLNVGQGSINYVETHPIILDFRNNDGEGYYWVDLETYNSPEECERMGHCGRSSKGKLFSLRSDKKIGKFKLNRSHLTAAIGDDGIIFQLKGPKNSKPKEEYHQYILPLFSYKYDGDYLISGFGSEYASQQDFKLEDLPTETLKELYQDRPEIFKSRGLKNKMKELGIEIEVESLPTIFDYEIESEYVYSLIEHDEVVKLDKHNKMYLSEAVLEKDFDYLYENFDERYDYESWEDILENYVYDGLKSHIRRLLMMMVEKNEEDIKLIKNYENKDLIDFINEIDINDQIKDALVTQHREVSLISYMEKLNETLLETLNQYGDVSLSNRYVRIYGDLSNFVDLDDPDVIEVYDEVENEHENIYTDFVFSELIGKEIIPKPIWDRPYPDEIDLDEDKFNDYLNNELNEIQNRI